MEELIQVFLEESREILQQLETDLLEMEKNGDLEIIKRVFRAAHTIKGSAGLTGLDCISSLAHRLEDVLDQVRATGEPMSKECFDAVFRSMDMLNKMVDWTAEGTYIPPDIADELKGQLSFFLQGEATGSGRSVAAMVPEPPEPAKSIFRISMSFRPDILETGNDPLKYIMELRGKGIILDSNVNISKLPELDELDPQKIYLSWVVILETESTREEIEEVFIFIADDNDIHIRDITDDYGDQAFDKFTGELLVESGLIDETQLQETLQKQARIGEMIINEAKVAPGQVDALLRKQQTAREQEQVNTIRVDTRRLEQILNSVAELVISQSRVKELVSKQSQVDVEVFTAFEAVDKIIRNLQEEVMKTSMVPIGGTFTRFQRMVRDLAAEKGKEINLIIKGQETELDKRVIEQITDPLKHMIRNAVDHGLEMPEERERTGKPTVGAILLRASHQEGNVVIEVADDGGGLDEDKIRRKALEKGLIEESQRLGTSDIHRLIMMPGFSTADKVSDISGRGVGMDVVATNIQALRGTLEIESDKGVGTRYLIKLPLTLAIIDGMMVTVGEEKFVLPLSSIVEFIKADRKDIKTVEGAGRVVNVRSDYIPLAALHHLMGVEAYKTDPTEGLLVVIKDAKKKMALLVDDILGQEQVVTKSLKENYNHIEGVAGATILGDGRVSMILDVPTLIKMTGKYVVGREVGS